MCCGQKRQALQPRRIIPVMPSPARPQTAQRRNPLVFTGTGEYLVAGPHSREVYHFSSSRPEQWVDARDVSTLLRTGLFQAKG